MISPELRSLLRVARPEPGERARLILALALAGGAAAAAIALLATSGYLISRAAQRPEILMLMVAIVAVRGLGIARAALRYGERLASHDLALRGLVRLRRRFYRSLAPRVPGALTNRSGDLLSRFVADVDTLGDLYPRVLIPGLLAVLVVLGGGLAAWLILPAAGLAVLGSLALAALVLPALSAAASARAARRQAPARAQLTSELVQGIDGALELALAGRAAEQVALLKRSDARLARIARGDAFAGAATVAAGSLLSGAGLLALLLVAIPAVHSGALSGVLLAALALLLLGAYESILPLSGVARAGRACATAAARLHELELTPPAVTDPPRPQPASAAGELVLEDVAYRYAPDEPWLLDGAELRLAPGERVALVGPSGIGKSTLAELLVRFRDPERGSVRLDGTDLRELTQAELRETVGLCAQDSHLFNTTIRENLLLANHEASEAQLARVLAAVELEQFVSAQPQGLDTLVGQGGELISGGQRTRIALARALLCKARFLILDEPTAHLEPELAARVMAKLLDVCDDRGLLVITHDAAALEGFDRVLRLQHGSIASRDGQRSALALA
jgi:thiol reductant ABC exporter CydC subunit